MNEYGLDVNYFENKLKLVLRDIERYTPTELAREMARMCVAADANVLNESEFNNAAKIKNVSGGLTINM